MKTIFDIADARQTDMYFDETDNTFRFHTHENVDLLLSHNKRKYNDYGDKLTMGKRGEWHHVASVPKTEWEKWMRKSNGAVGKDPKVTAAYLNDPDYKYFKVAPTKL